MSTASVLVAEGIGKRFGGFMALEDINVSFERGHLTAIIGQNGAGKSTFFSLLSGAVAPTTGHIRFEGEDVAGKPQYRFARMGIARSYQITNLFPKLSVHENVWLACQAMHAPARQSLWRNRESYAELADEADAALAQVGLISRRKRLAASLAAGCSKARHAKWLMSFLHRLSNGFPIMLPRWTWLLSRWSRLPHQHRRCVPRWLSPRPSRLNSVSSGLSRKHLG
jgi:ABC-type branched-subunit amino acid transport system ATPase component